MIDNQKHISVMLNESIEAMNINPSGAYIDATFGFGGHSRAILKSLNGNGRLYALSRRNIEDLVTNHFHLIKKELSEDWAIAKYMKKEYRLNNFAFQSLKVMIDYDKYDKYLKYMKNKKK